MHKSNANKSNALDLFRSVNALNAPMINKSNNVIDLTDEPVFVEMLTQWGYEPIGVPWTGHRICIGRVMDPEETVSDDMAVTE